MRTVILGGYGNFGARIARRLHSRTRETGIEVIVAGRHPEQGHISCGLDDGIGQARLDIRDHDLSKALNALSPDVVIHCVGPFQGQGYRVAEAALKARCHYIDLADGRAFVSGFEKHFNREALDEALVLVSGASTLPAISSAVIDNLGSRLASIDEIEISIAPAQRSPRGEATLKAVFSYLGRPFEWYVDGSWRMAIGWQELQRIRFKDLGTRWSAACEVPDLDFPRTRYPTAHTVTFRASLEFSLQHFGLAALAGLRRSGIPIPIDQLAGFFERMAIWLGQFGGQKGGMMVAVMGQDASGQRRHLEWHLTVGWKEGPEIPCLPAILLAERLAQGKKLMRGASACMGYLELKDFDPEFTRLGIQTEIMEFAL